MRMFSTVSYYIESSCINNLSFIQRPFNILGVQQVALGNLNKGELSKFWGDLLGLKKVHSFKSEKENVDEDVMEVGRGLLGKIEIDLMTPLDPEKSPKVHIPPLNHIGLWVDDLPKCVEYLESKSQRYSHIIVT